MQRGSSEGLPDHRAQAELLKFVDKVLTPRRSVGGEEAVARLDEWMLATREAVAAFNRIRGRMKLPLNKRWVEYALNKEEGVVAWKNFAFIEQRLAEEREEEEEEESMQTIRIQESGQRTESEGSARMRGDTTPAQSEEKEDMDDTFSIITPSRRVKMKSIDCAVVDMDISETEQDEDFFNEDMELCTPTPPKAEPRRTRSRSKLRSLHPERASKQLAVQSLGELRRLPQRCIDDSAEKEESVVPDSLIESPKDYPLESSTTSTDIEEEPDKSIPAWATVARVREALERQRKMSAETIFGELPTVRLERIFKGFNHNASPLADWARRRTRRLC